MIIGTPGRNLPQCRCYRPAPLLTRPLNAAPTHRPHLLPSPPLQGLTATIYTAVYLALFQPNALQFLLFLAVCPSTIAVVLSIFINRVPPQ